MARLVPVVSDEIKNIIALEGRPVRLSVDTNGNGDALIWNASSSEWEDADGRTSFAAGTIAGSPGKAIYIESVTVTVDQAGLVEGFFSRNANAPWLGGSDPNVGGAIDDAFTISIGEGGGGQTIPVGILYGEFYWFTATYRPMRKSTLGLVDPNVSITIKGYEITNDFNFRAQKRLLYVGDSLSWSLVGDWRTQDQSTNMAFAKESSSLYPFVPNLGDTIASFRLIKKLRENGEDIRLVNKGFGGSKMIQEQWFALKNQLYTLPWNMMVIQAGANDAGEVQTPFFQLTFKDRASDFVRQRNSDGRSKYPIVFCNAPSLDDKSGGTNSRNCLDVRVPVDGESYGLEVNTSLSSTCDLSDLAFPYWIKVFGNNTSPLEITNGVAGQVYRIDFWDESRLLTGTTSATYSFIKTLASYNKTFAVNGIETIPARTTLFLKAQNNSVGILEYKELDRVRLVGHAMAADSALFDPVSTDADLQQNHFIASANGENQTTRIIAPAINNLLQESSINSVSVSVGFVRLNFAASGDDSPITTDELPVSAQIDTNDVWVRISGMTDEVSSPPTAESWSSVNGFHRVVGYAATNGVLTSLDISFDARDGAGRDFSGTYAGNGKAQIVKCRRYTPMFETSDVAASSENCFYFQNGDVEDGDYVYRWQLKNNVSRFNLLHGKGIVFSCYQQGNVIYMNEIISGDIVNTGTVYGANTETLFWGDENETGKTRTQIINENIQAVVTDYSSSSVYLADLNDASVMKDVSETAGGRIYYGETTEKNLDPAAAAVPWEIGDLIEDPVFKRVGDSGTNECVVGGRVHRSPYGHELMYNRLWAVIKDINIPL